MELEEDAVESEGVLAPEDVEEGAVDAEEDTHRIPLLPIQHRLCWALHLLHQLVLPILHHQLLQLIMAQAVDAVDQQDVDSTVVDAVLELEDQEDVVEVPEDVWEDVVDPVDASAAVDQAGAWVDAEDLVDASAVEDLEDAWEVVEDQADAVAVPDVSVAAEDPEDAAVDLVLAAA